VNNENEFYKKLYSHIVEHLSTVQKYSNKILTGAKEVTSRIKSLNIEGSIEIGESQISYFEEVQKLIKEFKLEDERIIVLIDEFAQTVENISQDENERAAIHFLECKRVIRQSPEIYKRLQFIYAGSIGLENIVSRMNAINLINDLVPIKVSPLTEDETKILIANIVHDTDVQLDADSHQYLLQIIEWWIPFYFHLLLDEAGKILEETNTKIITKQILDKAVKSALAQRLYFEQWYTRVRKAYQGQEFSFVKELLNYVSEKQTVTFNDIYNLAIKHKVENIYKDLLNALVYDGYINNNENPKVYRFNSPLLREWWKTNVAN
jgi:uncharacterized protein